MVENIVPEHYPYTEAGSCGGGGLHHRNTCPKLRPPFFASFLHRIQLSCIFCVILIYSLTRTCLCEKTKEKMINASTFIILY